MLAWSDSGGARDFSLMHSGGAALGITNCGGRDGGAVVVTAVGVGVAVGVSVASVGAVALRSLLCADGGVALAGAAGVVVGTGLGVSVDAAGSVCRDNCGRSTCSLVLSRVTEPSWWSPFPDIALTLEIESR